MKNIVAFFREAIFRVFLSRDSADVEVLTAILTSAASVSTIQDVNSPASLVLVCQLSIVASVFQLAFAFPFNYLEGRHYSNYLMVFVSLTISYILYHSVGGSGIGGYGIVALISYYSAFKTRLELNK